MIRFVGLPLIVGTMMVSQSMVQATASENWYPFPVEVWDTPFHDESQRRMDRYVPLEVASERWRICVSFPHVKDSYWIAVNYGLTQEAKRLGVGLSVFEAGGYENLERQIDQIRQCGFSGADGVIISAISGSGLSQSVKELTLAKLPVVDLVNGMNVEGLSARSAVNFGDMGYLAGRYLVEHLGDEGRPIRVAWFPGPEGAAWVGAGDAGFRRAIQDSNVKIVATRYGDTGAKAQGGLLEDILDSVGDIDVIAGTAVTAEAAVGIVRRRGLSGSVKLLSYYYSPGVHRAIRRGQILAAPTDSPAIQGRIAVDQMVRILEGRPFLAHVGPKIRMIDRETFGQFDSRTTLAPSGFRVIFEVN